MGLVLDTLGNPQEEERLVQCDDLLQGLLADDSPAQPTSGLISQSHRTSVTGRSHCLADKGWIVRRSGS